MDKMDAMDKEITRRDLLRAAAVGLCSMCVSGFAGCAPKRDTRERQVQQTTQKIYFQPVPSPWFVQTGQKSIRCKLCPRQCELAEGQRSPCNVRENREGSGYTLAYGNPALVQEDPVERNPFYHVKPSSRVLSLCTAGCNLACKFCELWDIALVRPEQIHSYEMSPAEIITTAQASGVSAVCYAFGEPVVFYEYMSDIADLAKTAGLMNLIHTAGYIQPEPLSALCGKLDAANVDLKSFDPSFYRDVVGGELEPVLQTIKMLHQAGVHLEITNLVIPTLNDDMGMIREMCAWIKQELGEDTPLHFARFYPLYKLSALPRTPVATLDQARAVALDAGLKYVYVAKVIGHEGENTFCPVCGEMIIKRVGFVVEYVRLEDGRCSSCGTPIPGLWG